jgi:vacuolar-type H+-ATPase subunit F/Vma7
MDKKTIDKIKELLAELLPENNIKIVFNIPGNSDKPERLKEKIKIELTEFI